MVAVPVPGGLTPPYTYPVRQAANALIDSTAIENLGMILASVAHVSNIRFLYFFFILSMTKPYQKAIIR